MYIYICVHNTVHIYVCMYPVSNQNRKKDDSTSKNKPKIKNKILLL